MNNQRDTKGHFFGYGIMVIGLALSIYSAFHQFNFIQVALPPNQKEWGYFAIVAFDIGMIGWAGTALLHARGDLQQIIAWIMTAVSFFGVAAGLVMDTFLMAGKNGYSGQVDKGTVDLVIWISVTVMLMHIGAGIIYVASDPSHNERKRQERLRNKIESEAWKMSDQQVEILAAQLAPKIAQDQMTRLAARYSAGLGHVPRSTGQTRPVSQQRPQQSANRGNQGLRPVKGLTMRLAQEGPEPPEIEDEGDEGYELEIVERPRKPKGPPPAPTAEEVIEHYDPQEQEEEDEGDLDFLSQDGQEILINPPNRPKMPGNA